MKTLSDWLDGLPEEAQWIEYSSEDGDYSGRISLVKLREGAEALPPVPLILKSGRTRFRHVPSTHVQPDTAMGTAMVQTLVTLTGSMRELSAQINLQAKAAVSFQRDSAAAHIDLLRQHNEFVAEHAAFMLSSSAEIGREAASVAAQSRGESPIREAITALGEVWGRMLTAGTGPDPDSPADTFSRAELDTLARACAVSNPPLSTVLAHSPDPLPAASLRAIFEPHIPWLREHAMALAQQLPAPLVMRLRALT